MEIDSNFLQVFPVVADALPGGCFIYRADGNEELVQWNRDVLRIFGCATDEELRELTGNSFRGMVHPEDLLRVEDAIAAQMNMDEENGARDYVEYRIVQRNGLVRMVSDYGRRLTTEQGDFFVVFIEDATDTLTRSMLRFEDNFCKILKVNLTQDTFLTLKSDDLPEEGRVSRFSQWLRYFGEGGRVHPDELDSYFAYTNHYYLREYFRRDDRPWRLRYRRRAGGKYTWVMMEMLRAQEYTDSNQVILLYVQIMDEEFGEMSRRDGHNSNDLRLFAAASSSLYPLSAVINISKNDYHILRRKKGVLTDVADNGRLEELINIGYEMVTTPEDQEVFLRTFNRAALREAFYKGVPKVELKYRLMGSDGETHWMETVVLFVESPGEEIRAVAVFRYVDDEVAAMEKLRQAQRAAEQGNRAKEAFLFNMSHDIRTPLNAILGMAELAERHADKPEEIRHYMRELKDSGEMLLSVLKNVLEYARIASEGAELEEVPCNLLEEIECVRPMTRDALRAKRITVNLDIEIPHPMIYLDRSKLKVISLNIIDNAIKYTPQGGEVNVTGRQLPGDTPDTCWIKMEFEDNGVGMTQSFQKHIFEPFSRATTSTVSRVQGVGLGMSLVKSLVDLMGGTITIESRPAMGTKVTLLVPHRLVRAEEMASQRSLDLLDTTPLEGKRLLLAEDNDINAEITMSLLQEVGIEVERAEDGVECIAMLKRAEPAYYQLVLMDIQMPNMDGLRAAELIRSMDLPCRDIPIIALTANAFKEDKEKTLAAGMDAHLAKPIDVKELFNVLLQYLA